jgi:hypothetical protein
MSTFKPRPVRTILSQIHPVQGQDPLQVTFLALSDFPIGPGNTPSSVYYNSVEETDLAVSKRNPNILVTTWRQDRQQENPVSISFDSGRTWRQTVVPLNFTLGSFDAFNLSDVDIVINKDYVLLSTKFVSHLYRTTGIVIVRGDIDYTNRTIFWETPQAVASSPTTPALVPFYSFPRTIADPQFPSILYSTTRFHATATHDEIQQAVTVNDARAWSPFVTIYNPDNDLPAALQPGPLTNSLLFASKMVFFYNNNNNNARNHNDNKNSNNNNNKGQSSNSNCNQHESKSPHSKTHKQPNNNNNNNSLAFLAVVRRLQTATVTNYLDYIVLTGTRSVAQLSSRGQPHSATAMPNGATITWSTRGTLVTSVANFNNPGTQSPIVQIDPDLSIADPFNPFRTTLGAFRLSQGAPIPTLAADSLRNLLFLVYLNTVPVTVSGISTSVTQVYVSISNDFNQSWSAPIQVSRSSNTQFPQAFLPKIDIDTSKQLLFVMYYDNRNYTNAPGSPLLTDVWLDVYRYNGRQRTLTFVQEYRLTDTSFDFRNAVVMYQINTGYMVSQNNLGLVFSPETNKVHTTFVIGNNLRGVPIPFGPNPTAGSVAFGTTINVFAAPQTSVVHRSLQLVDRNNNTEQQQHNSCANSDDDNDNNDTVSSLIDDLISSCKC